MGEGGYLRPIDLLEPDTTTGAAVRGVPLNQVGIDHQARTRAVAQSRRAIRVVHVRAANRIGIRGALNHDAAAVGGNGRVAALIEHDRIVRDVAIEDLAEVNQPSALAGTPIAAHPVVVELVVVVAGA